MPDDPAYAEIRALRERLARLEALATAPPEDRSNPVTIIHPVAGDFATREERRCRSIASTFRRSEIHESLIERQAAALGGNMVAHLQMESLSPSERMSFGSYVNARDAAIAENLVDRNGNPR